jgi:hypothetical protein
MSSQVVSSFLMLSRRNRGGLISSNAPLILFVLVTRTMKEYQDVQKSTTAEGHRNEAPSRSNTSYAFHSNSNNLDTQREISLPVISPESKPPFLD